MSIDNIDLAAVPRNPPKCVECATPSRLVMCTDAHYPEPELHGRPMWECPSCGAFGRCKPGTLLPSSRPAGPDTRAARKAAYEAYRSAAQRLPNAKIKRKTRNGTQQALGLLWREMGYPRPSVQFGWMDRDTAEMAREFLDGLGRD